jgi:hypothetical protein
MNLDSIIDKYGGEEYEHPGPLKKQKPLAVKPVTKPARFFRHVNGLDDCDYVEIYDNKVYAVDDTGNKKRLDQSADIVDLMESASEWTEIKVRPVPTNDIDNFRRAILTQHDWKNIFYK